jgi:hypothetical protein
LEIAVITPQYALSIRQPWAWLLLHGGKDVENRRWFTKFRGPVWLHAAKGCTTEEYNNAVEFAYAAGFTGTVPPLNELRRGGIVGASEIVDCVRSHPSRWFVGPFGFVLHDVKQTPFMPIRGALGFFKPEITNANSAAWRCFLQNSLLTL